MKKQEILIYLKKREQEAWSKVLASIMDGNIEEDNLNKEKILRAEWRLIFNIINDLENIDLKVDEINPTDELVKF